LAATAPRSTSDHTIARQQQAWVHAQRVARAHRRRILAARQAKL